MLQLGPIRTEGANLTAHWLHTLADGGSLGVQAYTDFSRREVPPTFTESLDIVDLQLQHSLPVRGRHSIVWGASTMRATSSWRCGGSARWRWGRCRPTRRSMRVSAGGWRGSWNCR